MVASTDAVILERIAPPAIDDFGALTAETRNQARGATIEKSGVTGAVAAVRPGR